VGGVQMARRDEEFHQVVIVLEHIINVIGVTEVSSVFCRFAAS